MAAITFKVAVITSSVANIIFVVIFADHFLVAKITLRVAVMASSVANITFLVTKIIFSGLHELVSDQDHLLYWL